MAFNPCDVAEALICNPAVDDEMFKSLVLRGLSGIIIGSAMEAFKTINVPAGTDPVSGVAGTLNLLADDNVTITGNSGTDTVTFGLSVSVNDTFLRSRNAADSADIGILKVDALDNTVLNAGTGESILFTEATATQWSILPNGEFNQDATNGASINLVKDDTSVAQPVRNTVSAAGTVIGDATLLHGVFNDVTTVAAGSGVQLWAANAGTAIFVKNRGANALLVYPFSGAAAIDGGAVGAAVSVAVGALAVFVIMTSISIISGEMPAA